MSYVSPKGGSRQPTPKPCPTLGRITMVAWRQPTGGVRSTVAPAPGPG
jgi:hypothetical protein